MLVVSDIHANLDALEAVLSAAGGLWEGLLCLGDITGYGPDPEECVGVVRDLADRTRYGFVLAGNHDAALGGGVSLSWFGDHARSSVLRTADAVSAGTKAWLAGLPSSLMIPGDISPVRTLAVHASPDELLTGYLFGGDETALALETLERQSIVSCLCGHTHVPTLYRTGAAFRPGASNCTANAAEPGTEVDLRAGPVIVNPGSVGLPRFSLGNPHDESAWPSRYALWDTDTGIFTFKEVVYDRRPATARLHDLGVNW